MNTEKEIYAIAAETLAIQIVLAETLFHLRKLSPEFNSAIQQTFDDAASIAETTALHLGKSASPEHTVKAIRIIDEMRAVVFGQQGKPKHAV